MSLAIMAARSVIPAAWDVDNLESVFPVSLLVQFLEH